MTVKKLSYFTESEGLLPLTQEPVTCPYTEPDQSIRRHSPIS
jgi:hypothetical protein